MANQVRPFKCIMNLNYNYFSMDSFTDDRGPPPSAAALAAAAAAGKPYSPDGDDLVKIVMLGAPGVGKTSIIQVIRGGQKVRSKLNVRRE